jgi:hypothetical protein
VSSADRQQLSSSRASQRGVAQSGSAPALGAGGPGFESRRPDFSLLRGLIDESCTCPHGELTASSRAKPAAKALILTSSATPAPQ